MQDTQSKMFLKGSCEIVLVVSLFFLSLLFSQLAVGQEHLQGTVTKVIDGDSLQITINGRKIETRLYGIDSPEYDQRYSKAAKQFVQNQVYGKKVTVSPEYKDSYGRVVALVAYKEQSLNQELVASGYAWVYPRYCKKKICKRWEKDQKRAKKDQKGLWAEKNPVPPWRWKRAKRR